MTTRIPLDRIFDNPFQTRTHYTDIEELADSILKMQPNRPETSGLMQVPTARIVRPNGRGWTILNPDEYGGIESTLGDEPDAVIQLAFGHRRLRAFHHLNNLDSPLPEGEGLGVRAEAEAAYTTFPVEILLLDDRAMSDLAWEENAKRKDLSPIEEAEAIRQAIDLFGYTQTEIGQRWDLSQSAVANKLRLLNLPEEAQAALRSGQLSEKAGRALLAALGKSEAVYQAAALEILPVPVSEDKADKARQFIEDKNISPRPHRGERPADLACDVCLQSIHPDDPVQRGSRWSFEGVEYFWLCLPCYRAGSDWSPPTGPESEEIVAHAARTEYQSLSSERANFPLDAELNAPHVLHLTCEGCPARQGDACYNKACFTAKSATYHDQITQEVLTRLKRDYGLDPDQIEIISGYHGQDLNAHSVDPELVAPGGPCAPGQCDRLRLKYSTYVISADIKPYDDLPFVFNCNHAGAHTAAQKRYLKANETEEEKSEAVKEAEEKQAKKAEAKATLDNATLSLAKALANQQGRAWRFLLEELSLNPREDDNFLECVHRLAKTVFDYHYQAVLYDHANLNYHIGTVESSLAKLGIARLPDLETINGKLEKIYQFVYENRLHNTITLEQIQGNRDNLQQLVDQLGELHKQALSGQNGPSKAEMMPLLNRAIEISDDLWEAAAEIDHDLPQDWGISLEISINQLTSAQEQ